ncbi:MAG: Glucuronide carrier protein [Firmicutes bacterium ADurb.Bin300]|nr:MAG: Glucuronide carrier protein [Firmicutes bacterium ADurb.Bin300]HOD02603.1 MFS transporter [Clostridiales bacterium]
MSNSSPQSAHTAVNEQKAREYIYENRRYVGLKETVWYVVFDMCQSFNINTYSSRFVTNILQIDLNYQTIINGVNGVWDIVNDIFIGALVDKTRTRWGKFKPYLVALGIPGTLGTCLYWLLPLLFPNTSPKHFGKFLTYFLLAVVREGAGTFRSIAQTGMLATITPHPTDRTRLITVAQFWSGFLGEKLPEQIMTLLLDLIGNKVINMSLTSTFVFMGNFTSIVSGTAALIFCIMTRERILQSVERPSIMQGVRSIVNNKPVLLMTLSKTLSGFSISGSKSDYFIDVLNFASLAFFSGIPGAIVHPFSYVLVPFFRRHFSNRVLYILGAYIGDLLMIPVFLFGAIGGKKNGIYKRIVPMGLALGLWETVFMFFYGVRKVVPNEMYNEAMDYCEWKNGYRTEAMTTVAKGLAEKLSGLVSGLISLQIKKLIGYDITAYTRGNAQTDSTKFGLFTMFTIVPAITTSLGVIPMLFYDLNGEKRERMYSELLARRAEISQQATSGDKEALEKVAKEQMRIYDKTKEENQKAKQHKKSKNNRKNN